MIAIGRKLGLSRKWQNGLKADMTLALQVPVCANQWILDCKSWVALQHSNSKLRTFSRFPQPCGMSHAVA